MHDLYIHIQIYMQKTHIHTYKQSDKQTNKYTYLTHMHMRNMQ